MKQSRVIAVTFIRSVGSSSILSATGTFLRRHLWIWPTFAAAILVGIG